MNPTTPEIIDAAFYGRVSTDRQATSLTDQSSRAAAYAAGCYGSPLAIPDDLMFTDADVSGGTPFAEREGGAELLRVILQRGVRHLIVTKLDRLGRDSLDGELTMRWLKEHGVTLHVLDLGGSSVSTSGPIGELIIKIIFAIAEWDKKNIGTNIANALAQKFERGEVCGTVPYGWRGEGTGRYRTRGDQQVEIRTLVEHPEEQAVLREILRLHHAEGWGAQRIATELDRRKVPTRKPGGTVVNVRGHLTLTTGRWAAGHVAHILENRYSLALAAQLGLTAGK